jgi:membrane protein implicated in regulation of membrane protease activity
MIVSGGTEMPWWGWIAVGAILLVAEMTFVDLEFYLVLLGVSALIVGLLELSGLELLAWQQWVVFAGLSIGSLVFFRRRVYSRLRPPAEREIAEGVEGAIATAIDEIAPGATGAVSMRGTTWTARNLGASAIAAGARCRVARANGLELEIGPET